MISIKLIVAYLMTWFRSIVSFVPALVYQYIYSEFYTKVTYQKIAERLNSQPRLKNILDVGTATGHPLYSIIKSIPLETKVLGIDIDINYIPACKKLFENHPNVEIKEMNFYELPTKTENKFDAIIFGSSFMLMPNQKKALDTAKNALTENGKIYFLLTIYQHKSLLTYVLDYVKPYLKYLTTVDFGRMTYMNEFEDLITDNKLSITYKHRIQNKLNLFLKCFSFYVFQAEAIRTK